MNHPLRSAYLVYGWFAYSTGYAHVGLRSYVQEYEEQTTREARFVKGRQDRFTGNAP